MDPLAAIRSALADRYKVLHEIGSGGMATVYLARDVRHDRDVAIKLLRPELGAMLGPERFLGEIRVTARLQHPHVVPLFDSGEVNGLLYYVMPFIEGESLRERLEREKQLPVDDALRIARSVASALDYAHRHDIVHRDLKPANILLHDGQPLVSDFGIALAVSKAAGPRMTQTGLSLGTPQYMSPEQASQDRTIDARTDIYSLGVVLYEMLAGEPPYTGPTAQALMARVVTEEPRSLHLTRPTVPEAIERAVAKALAKIPADRFSNAQEFAQALEKPGGAAIPSASGARGAPRSSRTRIAALAPWVIALAAMTAAATALSRSQEATRGPAARFPLIPPVGVTAASPGAVSPTGTTIVFTGVTGAMARLFARDLDAMESRELPGTSEGAGPFFSPDGAWIAFHDGARIQRIAVSGNGTPLTLAAVAGYGGGTWGTEGTIVFSGGMGQGLWRVPAGGGEPVPVTRLDTARGETAHVQPHFLPGGEAFVFTILSAGEPQLAAAWTDGESRPLGFGGTAPHYVESGHLLFTTPEGALRAVPFDPDRAQTLGEPRTLIDGVRVERGFGRWSASPNGVLVWSRGDARSRLVLVDRDGHPEPLGEEARVFRMPRFSPDGSRIAVEVWSGSSMFTSDIWIFDRRTASLSRFTSGEGNLDPVWTPDGRALVYARTRGVDEADIWHRPVEGTAAPRAILATPGRQWPWSWSADGGTLIYDDVLSGETTRIMALSLADGAVQPVVESDYLNVFGRISPNGRWLAYASNETGRVEVYVTPFPTRGRAHRISLAGGNHPAWSGDGRELFWRDGRRVMVASVGGEQTFEVRARRVLFEGAFELGTATNYDVSPDGRHFVMVAAVDTTARMLVTINLLSLLPDR